MGWKPLKNRLDCKLKAVKPYTHTTKTYGVKLSVGAHEGGAFGGGDVVMGFRPEDAQIVDPGRGLFDATVFAAELTGDVTLVTVNVGTESLSVKMPKEYDVGFDSAVAVRFPLDRGFLFDAASGERLAAGFVAASAA